MSAFDPEWTSIPIPDFPRFGLHCMELFVLATVGPLLPGTYICWGLLSFRPERAS